MKLVQDVALAARSAASHMAAATPEQKARALHTLASLLERHSAEIICANEQDLVAARAAKMNAPHLDRLTLSVDTIGLMANACREVADMADPVGAMETQWQRPNGLLIGRMRVPLGVVAIIYESRPNVTIDAAILCLKAGNAVILRGGSEALSSNRILARLVAEALHSVGLPKGAVGFIDLKDRSAIDALCALGDLVDVLIPRGGSELIKRVTAQATMPVLKHDKGVCHMYIDAQADLVMATSLVVNSKVQRPGVCNALECLLVHKDIATSWLPQVDTLLNDAGVVAHACPLALPLLGDMAIAATPDDYGCEYGSLDLAIRVVEDFDAALAHIAEYGSNHTEIICTGDHVKAMRFVREVDAAMTGVNMSTRFTDGGQLGLGAEIGISTSKLHAYGPMGVRELTTTKFVGFGTGQVRG